VTAGAAASDPALGRGIGVTVTVCRLTVPSSVTVLTDSLGVGGEVVVVSVVLSWS
jgi:hypothetical protein